MIFQGPVDVLLLERKEHKLVAIKHSPSWKCGGIVFLHTDFQTNLWFFSLKIISAVL